MKLKRVDTSHYNGQSKCRRCGEISWSSMMVEYEQLEGHYCSSCAHQIELEQEEHEN